MECKRGWSTEFMAANFPLVFRNDVLRKHRRKVLFEREKAMLPAMQIYVEYKRAANEFKRQFDKYVETFGHPYRPTSDDDNTLCSKYNKARADYRYWEHRVQSARAQIRGEKANLIAGGATEPFTSPVLLTLRIQREAAKKEFGRVEKVFKNAQQEYTAGLTDYQRLQTSYYEYDARYNDRYGAAPAAKREFIMKCPDEGCRGFLSSAYKCGTCTKWTCSHCLVCIGTDKDAAHTCNNDTVETAKTIKAETRPCPKCGTRIFKIDGCNQMWCVMDGCHTAFDWVTGHVVTGVVHNPHYYEWLRRNGGGAGGAGAPAREMGDIPCGGLPGAGQLAHALTRLGIRNSEYGKIMEIHRYLRELIDMRMADYPARPAAGANKDNDVRYLMQEIDEVEWKRQLEFTEAKFKRKKEIGQILQMISTTGSDMLNQIAQRAAEAGLTGLRTGPVVDSFKEWLNEMGLPQLDQLREFSNQSLLDLAKREHMAVPQFGPDFKWLPLRALYRAAPKKKGAAVAEAAEAVAEAATTEAEDVPPPLEEAEAATA